jgi:hypothetical protein
MQCRDERREFFLPNVLKLIDEQNQRTAFCAALTASSKAQVSSRSPLSASPAWLEIVSLQCLHI